MGIFVGEKLANLANCELFANIFLANIHRYTENVFDICTDCSLFTTFSYTCTVCQNFLLPNISHVQYFLKLRLHVINKYNPIQLHRALDALLCYQ